jgi:hypothetical protein
MSWRARQNRLCLPKSYLGDGLQCNQFATKMGGKLSGRAFWEVSRLLSDCLSIPKLAENALLSRSPLQDRDEGKYVAVEWLDIVGRTSVWPIGPAM